MFIYSVKANTLKLAGCVLAAIMILCALIVFVPTDATLTVNADNGKTVYTEVRNNEDRVDFLSQFGYEVNETPVEQTDVTIPAEFDTVFTGYNALQKLQGLDLSNYKRKKATRYTYQITNYDGYDGKVYANMIVYRGRVIGGDVCTENSDGFIHGFSKSVHL